MHPERYASFREKIVSAIWRDLAPLEAQIEETGRLPYDVLLPHLRAMGAFGLLIPERLGGVGLTIAQCVPVLKELAKVHGGIRALVHVHVSMSYALQKIADAACCEDLLPAVARGQRSITFGLTEPDNGTGNDISTLAVRHGNDYVINGRKWLISSSDFASHFILFVRTGPAKISALLVERDTPGLKIEPLPDVMGARGGEVGQLTFRDARVPVTARLGEEGEGLEKMQQALEVSRVFVAASSLGTADRALELSVQYAKKRVTFGKAIATRQAVQRYLAEMATDVHALAMMLADAADKADAGQPIAAESSMCKLFGLEAVARVTDRAMFVHGGIGFTRLHSIERLYRDARLNWFEEGTPTIQHTIIARELLTGDSRLGAGEVVV